MPTYKFTLLPTPTQIADALGLSSIEVMVSGRDEIILIDVPNVLTPTQEATLNALLPTHTPQGIYIATPR